MSNADEWKMIKDGLKDTVIGLGLNAIVLISIGVVIYYFLTWLTGSQP